MENCNDCPCSCKIMSDECVTRFADIKDPTVLTNAHWQKATDDIDNLIGIDCAEQLCTALVAAVEEANAYNTANPPAATTFADYLDEIWLNIINNRHFQKWYANRLLWHWLHGDSISDVRASGLVVQSNTDEQYKNGFIQATKEELARRIGSASMYATQGSTKFLNEYWYKNIGLYSCAVLECGCTCTTKCATHRKKIGGIGFVIK